MCEKDNKNEIIKTAFEVQTKYLQWLSEIDFKIFAGFLTIQLGFGGWLSKNPPDSISVSIALMIIDCSITSLACALLWKNQIRRGQEVEKLKNIYHYLEFLKKGSFLDDKALFPDPISRPSLWLNIVAIIITLIGIVLLLFNKFLIG